MRRSMLALAATLLAAPVCAQIELEAPRQYLMSDRPGALALSDLDGDGDLDLVCAREGTHLRPATRGLSVLFNQGDGSLGQELRIAMGASPNHVAVDDMTGDGIPDLVATDRDVGKIRVYRGDGKGGFGPAVGTVVGADCISFVLGDFNEDRFGDVALIFDEKDCVRLFFGDGTGSFPLEGTVETPMAPGAIARGDLDADGHSDLVVGWTDATAVLRGHGDGSFTIMRRGRHQRRPIALAIGDINGDGFQDVTVLIEEGVVYGLAGNGTGDLGHALLSTRASLFPCRHLVLADLDGSGSPHVIIAHDGGLSVIPTAVTVSSSPPFESWVVSQDIPSQGNRFLSAADLDGDGHVDVAAARDDNAVSILLGTGSGAFLAPSFLAVPDIPYAVVTGDFTGDGSLDLGVLHWAPFPFHRVVQVLSGDGNGGFSPTMELPIGFRSTIMAALDLNDDEALDIVVSGGGSTGVFLNEGGGRYAPLLPVDLRNHPNCPDPLAVIDMDLDGRDDLVAALCSGQYSSLAIFFNEGSGTLREPLLYPTGIGELRSFRVADINLDGIPDVMIQGTDVQEPAEGRISVLRGDGTRGFRPPRILTTTPDVSGFALLHLDDDGLLDLVLTDSGEGTLSIAPGRGDGTFGHPVPSRIPGIPRDPIPTDLDQDGYTDVVVRDEETNSVLVFSRSAPLEMELVSEWALMPFSRAVMAATVDGDSYPDLIGTFRFSGDLMVIRNASGDLLTSRRGNVNAAAGPIADVLLVNESPGLGPERRLVLDHRTPLTIRINRPPSKTTGRFAYALYGWIDTPRHSTLEPLPFDIGTTGLSTPLTGGEPQVIWSVLGHPDLFGVPTLPSDLGPTVVFSRAEGALRPVTFFLQGLVVDRASPQGQLAVTNGVEVVAE
jgi:hypothetical protein